MPTPTTYSYTISTDITAAKVNLARLEKEIAADQDITIGVASLDKAGDTLNVNMKDALPGTDKVDHLDPLVLAHPGTPLPEPAVDAQGNAIFRPYGFATAEESSRWKGLQFTSTLNATSEYHFQIPNDFAGIQGGAWYVADAIKGDLIEFRLTDQDNILGYGAGLVVDKFFETHYVWPDKDSGRVQSESFEPLIPGLYLTIHYVSTATTGNAPWISLDLFAIKV